MAHRKLLGQGGFGEIHLERNKEDGKVIVVERIVISNSSSSNSDCE